MYFSERKHSKASRAKSILCVSTVLPDGSRWHAEKDVPCSRNRMYSLPSPSLSSASEACLSSSLPAAARSASSRKDSKSSSLRNLKKVVQAQLHPSTCFAREHVPCQRKTKKDFASFCQPARLIACASYGNYCSDLCEILTVCGVVENPI